MSDWASVEGTDYGIVQKYVEDSGYKVEYISEDELIERILANYEEEESYFNEGALGDFLYDVVSGHIQDYDYRC